MDSSGGMIQSLAGHNVEAEEQRVSLTFWKGWQDLERFLRSSKSKLFADTLQTATERLKPQYCEVVWKSSGYSVDTVDGITHWALNDFSAESNQDMEALLDGLRLRCRKIARLNGFSGASIWIDKYSAKRVVLATHWSGELPPSRAAIDEALSIQTLKLPVKEARSAVFKVQALERNRFSRV